MHCAPTPPKNSCPRRPQCGSKRGRRKRRVIRGHDDHTRAWDERHHAPPQPIAMSGRGVVSDMQAELHSLREDLKFTTSGRAARTLAKTAGLRVTLVLIN